jgi:hypothetical protein
MTYIYDNGDGPAIIDGDFLELSKSENSILFVNTTICFIHFWASSGNGCCFGYLTMFS